MIALCAVSLFAITACSSDDDNTPAAAPVPVVAQGTSGIISSIDINGVSSEVWNYNDEQLVSVTNAATGQEKVRFGYDGNGRVNTVTFGNLNIAGIPLSGTLRLHYNDNKLVLVKMTRNNTDLFSAAIDYNGNQMSHATVDLSDSMLLSVFNSVASQILGNATGLEGNLPTIDDVTTDLNLGWTGDNVTSLLLDVNVQASSTLGELANIIGDFSLLGDMASAFELAATMFPDQPVTFNITLADTTTFTYDFYNNPYQGYFGQLDVSTLSANNVLTKTNSRAVNVSVSLSVLNLPDRTFPLANESTVYTYQLYNQGGYPVKVSSSTGEVKEFHYKETE